MTNEADEEVERVLADADGARREELAALQQTGGEPLHHVAEIGQPEAVEQRGRPRRQRPDDLLEDAAEAETAGLNALVHAARLARQRYGHEGQRQDHEQHDEQDGGDRRKRAPLLERSRQPPA